MLLWDQDKMGDEEMKHRQLSSLDSLALKKSRKTGRCLQVYELMGDLGRLSS